LATKWQGGFFAAICDPDFATFWISTALPGPVSGSDGNALYIRIRRARPTGRAYAKSSIQPQRFFYRDNNEIDPQLSGCFQITA